MVDRKIGFTPNELALNSDRTRTTPLRPRQAPLGEVASETALQTGQDPFIILSRMQQERVDRFLALNTGGPVPGENGTGK